MSRVLPIASPCLLALGTCFFASEITEFVPIAVYVLTALAVAVLGIATWGVFVRNGEAGRPRLASACLGVPVFVAAFGGCLGLFALGGAVYEWYLWHHTDFRLRRQAYVEYSVNRQGHVLKSMSGLAAVHNGEKLPPAVTDLDAPQPNQPIFAPEKRLDGANAIRAPLPMGSVRQRPSRPCDIPVRDAAAYRPPRE